MDVIETIKKSFDKLKNKRFFVAEADFQHTLAMELEHAFKKSSDTSIILEFPMEQGGRKIYVDIMIVHNGVLYPIELKYKTKQILSDQEYGQTKIPVRHILKDQSAWDLGGYDIWKDVNRIERLIKNDQVYSGACIIISNDKYYWGGFNSPSAQGYAFRTTPGIYKPRKCDWNVKGANEVKKWIKKHPGFKIENEYNLEWVDFYDCGHKNGCFKSLFIPIMPKVSCPQSFGEAKESLQDVEYIRSCANGHISDECLEKLLSAGINPLDADGGLKSKNTLNAMLRRYADKTR